VLNINDKSKLVVCLLLNINDNMHIHIGNLDNSQSELAISIDPAYPAPAKGKQPPKLPFGAKRLSRVWTLIMSQLSYLLNLLKLRT